MFQSSAFRLNLVWHDLDGGNVEVDNRFTGGAIKNNAPVRRIPGAIVAVDVETGPPEHFVRLERLQGQR